MLPRSLSDDLLEALVDRLADRLCQVLVDRFRNEPAADLEHLVNRLERAIDASKLPASETVKDSQGGDSDRKWGFRFGAEGVVGSAEASRLMGGCSARTLDRHAIKGKIRRGKDGKRVVYCHRSVMQYLAGLEE